MKFCLYREDDRPSDVYGGPPLEHDIATNEMDGTAACYAGASSGVLWDGVENLDQVNYKITFVSSTGTRMKMAR